VKTSLEIDIVKLMKKLKLKKEGTAPLLWIIGRTDAIYFDGHQVFGDDVLRGLEGTEEYLENDYVLQESRRNVKGRINIYLSSLEGKEVSTKLKTKILEGILETNEQLQHKLRTFLNISKTESKNMPAFLAKHKKIKNYIRIKILPSKEFKHRFRKFDQRSHVKGRKIWEPED